VVLALAAGRAPRVAAAAAALIALLAAPAEATKIERLVSPGGIEAWLVRETAVPLIAVEFAFRGGATQDPPDKPGVANMVTRLLDEGAGDLDAKAFHEQLEEHAISIGFRAGRDTIQGSLRTLVEHRDKAFALLKLALNAPRFDAEAVERVRGQILAGLRREATSPQHIANRRWWETAFAGHPYGHPVSGRIETVPRITADDLRAFARRQFARDNLKIAIVGDIEAPRAAAMLDDVFGALPPTAQHQPVARTSPQGLGMRIVVDLNVPQAVLTFGTTGLARSDPDFIPAYVVNHILGGGSFSSRLYREVREMRGLAYSVYSSLVWLDHAAVFFGSTATRADRADTTLEIIEQQIRRLAEEGPTQDELDKAKSYLKGSYLLGFDTSAKIANQLVQIQLDDLGIDYINRRNSLIDAVTLDDARRVAKRILNGGLLVTMVGRRADAGPQKPGG
jgi:zinc protease